MSVEDWARDLGELYATAGLYDERGQAHADGIVHAFSALLSVEAVEAAAKGLSARSGDGLWENEPESRRVHHREYARAALQAAVAAVTEGDTE